MGRRDGRGGAHSRGEQVSKSLSKLLRHDAEKEGLKLGIGGYVNLSDALNTSRLKAIKVSMDEIREEVQSNTKQRFTLISIAQVADAPISAADIDNDNPAHFLIRANQGHSLQFESGDLLQPITLETKPSMIVHGTTRKAWPLIRSSGGLKPMGRNHVHFAIGLPLGFTRLEETNDAVDQNQSVDKAPVISGMRNSSSILIFINLEKALDMGLKFFISSNGVALCDGGSNGIIPLECFDTVEERTIRGKLLLKNGLIMRDIV